MKTAESVMMLAKAFVGIKESPANSNNVIFNTHYYGHAVSGSAYPWCCVFVWDVFRLAGVSDLFFNGGRTASCISALAYDRRSGLEVPKTQAKYGDRIYFDWNHNNVPDHIGLVITRNADGTFETIEGNTAIGNDSNGGEVMIRTRKAEDVLAVARPKYDEEVQPVKRYNKVSELPESLQPETQELIDCGVLRGVNDKGDLDITLDMDRTLIINKRYTDMVVRKVVDPGD